MVFTKTKIKGAFLIDLERHIDERGFFARSFCVEEFAEQGIFMKVVQCNISFNEHKWTLRGMHLQVSPHEEKKIVHCTRGSVYDVILDLRRDSFSFKQWEAYELSEDNQRSLFIPEGVAHGFLTLNENCEVFYQMSDIYHPESAYGVRWNDSAFGIEWPMIPVVISKKDNDLPDFKDE